MAMANPADPQAQKKRIAPPAMSPSGGQEAAPKPSYMPGTNPILDAMHATQVSMPQDVQNAMRGAASADVQAAQMRRQRLKEQQDQSQAAGHHPEPW